MEGSRHPPVTCLSKSHVHGSKKNYKKIEEAFDSYCDSHPVL